MTSNKSPLNVVFFGTPDFSVPTLKALINTAHVKVKAVVTQPDRPAGRGAELQLSPIKATALEHHIAVLQPENIRKNLAVFLEELKQHSPFDLGVVIAFGQILPEQLLALPRLGCINIHASILPRWRGAAPIQRAIMAGDNETGVCLMQMEAGLDTGPVFSEARVPIGPHTTFGELHDELAQAGANLLIKDLDSIASAKLKARTQSQDGVTYAHKIKSEEAHIDWTKSALEIDGLMRAFSPKPGAYSLWQGKRIKIFKAIPNSESIKTPLKTGECLRNADTISVKCGDGHLELKEVQLEGRKRMTTAEFLRGVEFPERARLE